MRGKKIDLTGQVFTWLTVISKAPRGQSYDSRWLCKCRCGNELTIYAIALRNGNSKSCGRCGYVAQINAVVNRTHGATVGGRTREYISWMGAKGRCFNIINRQYPDWGGRGITMCDRWRDSFAAFFEDMGPCPEGRSIHRIDNDGNYEPGNCKWATAKEQASNRRPKRV